MYSTMAFSLLDTPAELRREPAFLLYTDDFSRIQRFIYTVHTEGALRSLRSRSFFLELLMEHYMDELLDGCGLYVLCACEGNDQLKMLKELFPLLGLSGIGGRTSAGYGRLQRHQGDPSISARRLRPRLYSRQQPERRAAHGVAGASAAARDAGPRQKTYSGSV